MAKAPAVTFYATGSFNATFSLPLKAKTFEEALVEAKTLKGYQFIKTGSIEDYGSPDIQTIYKV